MHCGIEIKNIRRRILNKESARVQDGNTANVALVTANVALVTLMIGLAGTLLLNDYDSNSVAVGFVILVLFVVCWYTIRVENPLLVSLICYSIGLALLLSLSLRSPHMFGYDIHGEYFVYEITDKTGFWEPAKVLEGPGSTMGLYSSVLSVTILPTIISQVTGYHGEMIFRLLYPAIFALSLPVIYSMFRRIFRMEYAFPIVLLMLDSTFLNAMTMIARQEIALFLFIVSVSIIFGMKMERRTLILLFLLGIGIIASHYTTGLIYLLVLGLLFFSKRLVGTRTNGRRPYNALPSFFLLALCAVAILWYLYLTGTPFLSIISAGSEILRGLGNFLSSDMRRLEPLGFAPSGPYVLTLAGLIVGSAIRILIIVGLLVCVVKLKSQESRVRTVAVLASSSVAITLIAIVLPQVSVNYNLERLYLNLLPFMIVFFPIGVSYSLRLLRLDSHNARGIVVIVLVLSQIVLSTGLAGVLVGYPYTLRVAEFSSAAPLEEGSDSRFYVFDQEVYAARWLGQVYNNGSTVCADEYGVLRLWSFGGIETTLLLDRDLSHCESGDYIYLRYENVIYDEYTARIGPHLTYEKIDKLTPYFLAQSRIYDSGGSDVYQVTGIYSGNS